MSEKIKHLCVAILSALIACWGAISIARARLPSVGFSVQSVDSSKQISVGDRLNSLAGYRFQDHKQTLVMFLRVGCHFCEQSIPFYQRLAGLKRDHLLRANVIAAFPDSADMVASEIGADLPDLHTIPSVSFESYRILGTPTLAIADASGVVQRVWVGALSPAQENEVIAASRF